LLAVPLAAQTATQTATQTVTSIGSVRDRLHDSDQWRAVEAHLPDPKTAGPKELENQADILRARRFPEDALDYYRYALDRGGRPAPLLNKMGLTELEMRNVVLARGYFTRAVKLNKKDAEGWNNLGAVEYLDGASASAVSDYKKALKLNRREAVFHANLATAYFEQKDFKGARREIAAAMKLDPEVFERKLGGGGVAAHLLSSDDRARFSFEMAKLYARNGLEDDMLHSLAMASEAGMDVQREMRKDATLARFELDPRVVVLVHNAQALRAGRNGTASAAAGAGALPETRPVVE
jgi:tetratricopeptide (TPR) repeat protein